MNSETCDGEKYLRNTCVLTVHLQKDLKYFSDGDHTCSDTMPWHYHLYWLNWCQAQECQIREIRKPHKWVNAVKSEGHWATHQKLKEMTLNPTHWMTGVERTENRQKAARETGLTALFCSSLSSSESCGARSEVRWLEEAFQFVRSAHFLSYRT